MLCVSFSGQSGRHGVRATKTKTWTCRIKIYSTDLQCQSDLFKLDSFLMDFEFSYFESRVEPSVALRVGRVGFFVSPPLRLYSCRVGEIGPEYFFDFLKSGRDSCPLTRGFGA